MTIRRATRRFSLGRAEPLEDRRLLAAFAAGELIVQYEPTAAPATRDAVQALVRGSTAEYIHTPAMREALAGPIERIILGPGVSIDRGIAVLRNRPGVVSVEPNWTITTAAVSNDPIYTDGRLWGMATESRSPFGSQAAAAWAAGITGSRSVVVGIVDTGIDITHPDLRENIWVNPFEIARDGIDNDGNGYVDDIHGWDFAANDNTVFDGRSDDHGTHVAGTIGGLGGNGMGVAGVNWNVTMIAAKFLGGRGTGVAAAIRAIDYLTDLKTRHGINLVVSNHSWSVGSFSAALQAAINRHAEAGILVVAAAGNNAMNVDRRAVYPQGYSTRPAVAFEGVISVAALTARGELASFSNFGRQTVDLGAPGHDVQSTLPGGRYGVMGGTSMAAPHVTGAVALYAAAHPGASAAAIREAILSTTRPTAALAGRSVTGGRLDVAAALGIVSVPDGPPPDPESPPPAISIAGAAAAEGVGRIVFSVTLSAAAAAPITVAYATFNGTATAARSPDYVAAGGTLLFLPGETMKEIVVTLRNDFSREADETFFVNLSWPMGATIATGRAMGTILDDDRPAASPRRTALRFHGP